MTQYPMPWIPERYRSGTPSRHCSSENPYQGPCGLNDPTGHFWRICQRCGSHWFTVPVSPEMAWRWSWRWERLETYLFRHAVDGMKAQRSVKTTTKENER